jgi:hypothetical protein
MGKKEHVSATPATAFLKKRGVGFTRSRGNRAAAWRQHVEVALEE